MKTLACRLFFVLPIVVFGVFVLMIVFGMISSVLGAGDGFYCSVYCKLGIGLVVFSAAAALFTQVRACFKASGDRHPQILV